MSDTTEDMECGMGALDAELDWLQEKVDRGLWQQRNGVCIKVADMETSHIQNCLRLIKGNPVHNPTREMFKKELDRRFPPISQRPRFSFRK